MKVLVTGGTGFVGSHCVRALAAKGHTLRLLVRSKDKARNLFGTQLPQLELVQGDMTDAAGVRTALEGCEGVLHAAAMVALDASQAHVVMKANNEGVRAVLGGAVELGLSRIVHVSSVAAIFDPDGAPSTCESPLAEGSSPYARSKAAGDRYARELQAQGAPLHISYPVAVVGPDDPGLSEANHALAYMLKTTTVLTEGAFQMVDVRDLAQGHAALFDASASPALVGGRHLFGGHCLSWRELTDALSEVVGHKVRRISLPAWSLRAMGKAADMTRSALPFLPLTVPVSAEGMVYMTRWIEAQSSPSIEALGVNFRPTAQTLGDTLCSLHAAGQLSAKAIGSLARESARGPAPMRR